MNKLLPLVCQLIILIPLSAQNDLLGGIFGKEEPNFSVTVAASDQAGEIDLSFYYTHSKVDELEISFWVMDLGTNFIASGEKKMVRGLQNIGNRKEELVVLKGLKTNHFYTIGIDYRSPKGITRKFASKAILEGYHYKGAEMPGISNPETKTPLSKIEPRNDQYNQQPCLDPRVSIRVEPSGYCNNFDRPAVLIQCNNCQGKEWSFSVEIRDAYSNWASIRADGKRQAATGVALRTEPLCTLRPGNYELQVLAWGKNCPNPVVETLATTINIGQQEQTARVDRENTDSRNTGQFNKEVQSIPDSCQIAYQALLDNNYIHGTLELPFNSPCVDFNPYIKVRYVNPNYRDITTEKIQLLPGGRVPFAIKLDPQDLQRSIHTLQGIVYLGEGNGIQDIPVNTFWMKAGNSMAYAEPPADINASINQNEGEELEERGEEDEYESSLMEKSIDEVSVTAFDPNCTQIQDLQLVYGSGRSRTPLYMSWMSPRCCQEEGCGYSVWAGPAPDQLRLLVKGNKPGAVVKELMQNARASDTYYEVVVNTGNRKRKAAFVPGEGPMYGIEEIATYHDKINPPEDVVIEVESYDTYSKPTKSIDEFRSCRIYRKTKLSTDNSVQAGDRVRITYDYSEKGYNYTLYFQPEETTDWYLAPETEELSTRAKFDFIAKPKNSGKYVVLAYNASIDWGCLSLPVSEALELKVLEP